MAGAWPGGGWLVGLFALGLAGALYVSTRNDMFYVREQLYGVAAGCALLLVVVAAVWARKAARARAVFRDGTLVDATVVKRVEVRQRQQGIVAHDITVRFPGPDGRPREATFASLNQVVANPRVLVHGDRAALYLSAYQAGPLVVPAIFRVAPSRPAGA